MKQTDGCWEQRPPNAAPAPAPAPEEINDYLDEIN